MDWSVCWIFGGFVFQPLKPLAWLEEAVQINGGGQFCAGGTEIKRSAGCQALPVLLPVQLSVIEGGGTLLSPWEQNGFVGMFFPWLLDLVSKVHPASLKWRKIWTKWLSFCSLNLFIFLSKRPDSLLQNPDVKMWDSHPWLWGGECVWGRSSAAG